MISYIILWHSCWFFSSSVIVSKSRPQLWQFYLDFCSYFRLFWETSEPSAVQQQCRHHQEKTDSRLHQQLPLLGHVTHSAKERSLWCFGNLSKSISAQSSSGQITDHLMRLLQEEPEQTTTSMYDQSHNFINFLGGFKQTLKPAGEVLTRLKT